MVKVADIVIIDVGPASFVNSEPYVSKETIEMLKNDLQDIAG